MSDPFNWSFPKREDTMYLSTIKNHQQQFNKSNFNRQSTFLKHDINGAMPKPHVSQKQHTTCYNLSTYVEPKPKGYKTRKDMTNPLQIDDILGCRPKAAQFKTNRIVDPLCPKYQLASCTQFSVDPGRTFIRDTLEVSDINLKKYQSKQMSVHKQPVLGSTSINRTKQVNAVSRLEVKDINKQQQFQSKRTTNPLQPSYNWRDTDELKLNTAYGHIQGTYPRNLHNKTVNRTNNFSLNTKDIDGAWSNSYYSRAHFLDKRRQFRNYMQLKDIEKANPMSLKKGIQTKRQINPLMPKYQYPGNSQPNK